MLHVASKEARFLVVLLGLVLGLSVAIAACSGGARSVAPPTALSQQGADHLIAPHNGVGPMVISARNPRLEFLLMQAIARAHGPYKASLTARLTAILHPRPLDPNAFMRPLTSQYGDDTALIGGRYALDYYYVGLPASCGQLTWTLKTTMPGVSPTYNPAVTTLTGLEEISFQVPKSLPPGTIYSQTAQGHCTRPTPIPSPSPTPITHYTQAVALNAIDVNQNSTKSIVITSTSMPKILGQYINIVASPQPTPVYQSVFPAGDSPIITYTETLSSATVQDYVAVYGGSPYTPPNIGFYYAQTSDETIGYQENWGVEGLWYTNWCRGNYSSCFSGDQTIVATYFIYARTSINVTANVGSVLVTPPPQLGCNLALVLGIVNKTGSTCNGTAKHGADWTFTATGPANNTSAQAALGGLLDMTQLITLTNSFVPLPGATNVPTPVPNTNAALDTCIHFGNSSLAHATIAPSVPSTWTANDAPGTVLEPLWLSFTRSDVFNDYFVYRLNDMSSTPSSRKNIWVVLGDAGWGWGGKAVQATPTLTPTHVPVFSLAATTPAPYASAEVLAQGEPIWNSGFNTGNPLDCPPGG